MKALPILVAVLAPLTGLCLAEPEPAVSPECLISKDGIAGIHPGDTRRTLLEKLAKLDDHLTTRDIETYMVDFSAIAVMRYREVLFHAVFFYGEHKEAGSKIEFLETENPRFRTAEGVGPGMLVSTAAERYGEVTLGYNTENESRESVTFSGDKAPPSNIMFRPAVPSLKGGFAGIYDGGANGSYFTTKKYHPYAYLWRIGVSAPPPSE